MTSLSLTDVEHVYEGSVRALAGIDLAVAPGELVAVVGPSGCGKSTLLAIAAGLLAPTAGRVERSGDDVTGRAGHAGLMQQRDLLLPWRTVRGNVLLSAAVRGRIARARRAEADALLVRHGLSGFEDHYPHALSGGMRQRVALLRTLAFRRDLLLLDEPFASLDFATRLRLQEWLLEVWAAEGSTVVLVTHDLPEAVFAADRVVVLSARPGRVLGEVQVDLPRPRPRAVVASARFAELEGAVAGLLDAEAARAAEPA